MDLRILIWRVVGLVMCKPVWWRNRLSYSLKRFCNASGYLAVPSSLLPAATIVPYYRCGRRKSNRYGEEYLEPLKSEIKPQYSY